MVPDQAKARRGTERGPSETGQRAMLAVSGDGGGVLCRPPVAWGSECSLDFEQGQVRGLEGWLSGGWGRLVTMGHGQWGRGERAEGIWRLLLSLF